MTVRTRRDAAKILADVVDGRLFFCSDGCIDRNLAELSTCLAHMSQNVFNHHVNDTKNDFSTWIRDVLGDTTLADELLVTTSPAEAGRVVSERLTWLQKKAR